MNTIRSTWIGWGALCVAGGGAYYFAKQSVNADRAARYDAERKRKGELAAMERQRQHQQQAAQTPSTTTPSEDPSLKRANMTRFQSAVDDVASPSSEASRDPAATRHEPETEAERVFEKSKYETATPYRPPRGNRFS